MISDWKSIKLIIHGITIVLFICKSLDFMIWKLNISIRIFIRQNHQLTLNDFTGLIQDIGYWILDFLDQDFLGLTTLFLLLCLDTKKEKSRLDSFLNGYEDQ